LIGGKKGKFALATVFNGFYSFLGNKSSSRFLTGCCEKILNKGEDGGKRGKFAIATGEKASNREKCREVCCLQDH